MCSSSPAHDYFSLHFFFEILSKWNRNKKLKQACILNWLLLVFTVPVCVFDLPPTLKIIVQKYPCVSHFPLIWLENNPWLHDIRGFSLLHSLHRGIQCEKQEVSYKNSQQQHMMNEHIFQCIIFHFGRGHDNLMASTWENDRYAKNKNANYCYVYLFKTNLVDYNLALSWKFHCQYGVWRMAYGIRSLSTIFLNMKRWNKKCK